MWSLWVEKGGVELSLPEGPKPCTCMTPVWIIGALTVIRWR